jgi:protein TonB
MIAKKNSKYELESKRSAFFQVGLFVVGSIMLAAFSYSDPTMRADNGKEVARELIPIVWNEPDLMKNKTADLETVAIEKPEHLTTVPAIDPIDETSISTLNLNKLASTNITSDLSGLISGPKLTIGTGLVIIDASTIEDIVDKEAQFIGGYIELQNFIGSRINYPQEAIQFGEQGKVYMSFVIEKDGSVSNVIVERGVSTSLDREAKRIIKSFPEWIPGEIKMQRVRTRIRLPINFVLNN